MVGRFVLRAVVGIGFCFWASSSLAAVSTASSVLNYNAGTYSGGYVGTASNWSTGQAIGLPASTEGGYFGDNSIITPFNADYNPATMVAFGGNGGTIEFQMSKPITTTGFTLAVHVGAGLNDSNYPDPPAISNGTTYTNARQATLLVSQDGSHWVPLGDMTFSIPTNVYADAPTAYTSTPGSTPADFTKPFLGTLSSFAGEDFSQVLSTLNGSAGGTWVDLSGTGLSEVDYVQFQTGTGETMFVDGITGVAVPEPAGLAVLAAALLFLWRRARISCRSLIQ